MHWKYFVLTVHAYYMHIYIIYTYVYNDAVRRKIGDEIGDE